MNLRRIIPSLTASLVVMAALSAPAQTLFFKADNSDSLDLGTSWTNNIGVAPSSVDTAVWDFNVLTAANCTNTVGSPTWGGIQISNPAAGVKVTSTGTLTLGGAGLNTIDMSGASQDLWLALSVNTAADQSWLIPGDRIVSVGDASRNVNIQNNLAVNGHLAYMNNLRVQSGGTLWITNSASSVEPGGSAYTGTPIVVGNNGTGVNTVIQTAGTVKTKRTDGTSGSPNSSINIGSASGSTGVYTITGGSLVDVSTISGGSTPGGSYLLIGSSATSTGTLNVDGTASVQVVGLRMANNSGVTATLNLTNGAISVGSGNFDVGRTTGNTYNSATVNVYGGTLTALGPVNVPHGNGPGFLNLYGGNVACGGSLQLQDSSAGTGSGTVTVNGGSLVVTNNIGLPQSGASGVTGTFNLNGGTVTATAFTHPSANTGTLNLNGGTLKPRSSSANLITRGIIANVLAGGAVIDTATYNPTIPAALLNGTGGGADGGLTKLGPGMLTLSGANTYTGPTRVKGGGLSLSTTNHGGGSIVLDNAALLHVTVGASDTTLNCSSLALGSLGLGLGGVVTNELDLNGFANPAVPVVNASSLSAAGTVYINIIGSGWGEGTYHLIQYSGNVAGNDFAFVLNSLAGAVGYVTNNTSTHFVDLVITSLPNLVWRAQINTNWDTTTANWVDLETGLQTTYPNGAAILFDDSASNATVFAAAEFSPAAFTVNNLTKPYNFTGAGRIRGVTGLIKDGSAPVVMALTNNDYSGNTIISNGTFTLGTSGVIPDGTGKGDVTLEGKLDLNGFSEAINGLSGKGGIVDNSGGGAVVLTVGNGGASGSFAGQITNSTGSLALAKAGGGALLLLSKNGYSGGTTAGGTLQLAYEQSIGTGPLSLGGTLLWTDAVAHTLTNPLTLTASSTFGADTNGPLAISGIVDFGGGGRTLTCNTDVLLQNGMNNGGLTTKAGTGTLTIRNHGGDWAFGSLGIQGGSLVLDNAAAIQDGNNVRIQCTTANGTARLVITNGASLTTSNSPSSNFRVGDLAAAGTTNILDLAGAVTVLPYSSPSTGDKFQMGGPGSADIVNLLPGGVLRARQVAKSGGSLSIETFNFDGGTLSPNTNDFAAAFMQGLDYCYVQDGGAVIDTAGWDITISQQLIGAGIGGLTKNGTGTLTLNPDPQSFGFVNSYTGDTVVNRGTLVLGIGALAPSMNWVLGNGAALDVTGVGLITLTNAMSLKGSGTVRGLVNADPGATIAPGAAIGTLVLDTTPILNGTLLMELYRSGSTVTNDVLRVSNGSPLAYGGTLTVTSIGGALRTGDTFKLFDAGSYIGVFTSTNLPAGVTWDVSGLYTEGTIKVLSAPAPKNPQFGAPALVGGNLVLSGSGGAAGSPYYVLSSTNVALPLSFWTPISTNVFAADGRFTNSIPVDPAKLRLFFDIEVP